MQGDAAEESPGPPGPCLHSAARAGSSALENTVGLRAQNLLEDRLTAVVSAQAGPPITQGVQARREEAADSTLTQWPHRIA